MSTQQPHIIHELTDAGIRAAKDYLASLREGKRFPFPETLLTGPQYAAPIEPRVHVEQRSFDSRRDAGLYLVRRLAPLGSSGIIGNHRLWSWLGMFYFESMVEKDADGTPLLGRKPDIAFVIDPQGTGRGETRRYAHRLMLAYEIYTRHEERAWLMLDDPIDSLNRFTLRLSDKQEAFRSVGVIDLAHRLYADRRTRKLNPGATQGESRFTAPPGSLYRLLDVLDQLYMTYDVYGMTADRILPLLPPEFDRFKPVAVN